MADYMKDFSKSFLELRKQPVLLIPKLLALVSSLALTITFLLTTDVGSGLFRSIMSDKNPVPYIRLLLTSPWLYLYLLLELSISVFFSGVFFSMVRRVIEGKKPALSFSQGIKMFPELFRISIIYYLLMAIPIFALSYIYSELVLSSLLGNSFIDHAFFALFLVLFFAWSLLISLRFLFVWAAAAFRQGKMGSMEAGAHFARSHMKHTVFTWLFVILLQMTFTFLRDLTKAAAELSGIGFLVFIVFLALVLFEISVSAVEQLFIFNEYKLRKG